MREEGANPRPERRVARLAAREHGVLTTAELVACGLSTSAINRAVNAGRLHRIHRGVYAVGHPRLTEHGRWLAAVKACGAGAALSHQSAAQLSRMLFFAANLRPVHVTVPGTGGRRRRKGIVVHRSSTLRPNEIVLRDGIPTTNPRRTLADLRSLLSRDQWEDAYRVDFLWREHCLIVETDGWESHRDRASFEADRARDAALKLMGYEVVRFTWRQVCEKPERVAQVLRELVRRRGRSLTRSARAVGTGRVPAPSG